MTGATAAFWAFLVMIGLLGYRSMRQAERVKSVCSFFYDNDLKGNVLSYTAANITLGTGLIYILSATGSIGVFFLLAPLMTLLGYLALAKLCKYADDDRLFKDNLVKELSIAIDRKLGGKMRFAFVYSVVLVVVFSLLLAFEVFASAKIISSIVFYEPSVRNEIFIGTIIFMVALVYTLWGGFKAVKSTDRVQVFFMFLMLLGLVLVFFISKSSNVPCVKESIVPVLDVSLIFSIVAAGIAAFTTQFYSILNLCAASQQKRAERCVLFKRIGKWTFAALGVVVIGAIAVHATKGNPYDILIAEVQLHAKGVRISDAAYSVILLLGMSSVLFSTIDSLIVSITQVAYSNLWGEAADDEAKDFRKLRVVRIAMIAFGPISFAILCFIWYLDPNIFQLLLGVTSGNDVLAPLMIMLIILYKKNRLGNLRGPRNFPLYLIFIALFGLAFVLSVVFFLNNLHWNQYIGPPMFVISSGIALWIVKRRSAHG